MHVPPGGRLHGSLIDADGLHEPKGHSTALVHSVPTSDGAGNTYWRKPVKDSFIPTNGQTVFTLSAVPIADPHFEVTINGVDCTSWFTPVGTTLMYVGPHFGLDTGDRVVARYNA